MHPAVLKGIIDAMAETARHVENRHVVEKGLLEEALDDLQHTRIPSQRVQKKA